MKVLILHGYLLRGTGSNIYNASLARALARLGHEVHLLCQERRWDAPEGVTVHNPDIGRVLPVYVADTYDGFDAKPYPDLTDAELDHYIEANVAAVRAAPTCDVALANHLVMNPVILARGLGGATPFAVKVHGSALEYTVRPNPAGPTRRGRARLPARERRPRRPRRPPGVGRGRHLGRRAGRSGGASAARPGPRPDREL